MFVGKITRFLGLSDDGERYRVHYMDMVNGDYGGCWQVFQGKGATTEVLGCGTYIQGVPCAAHDALCEFHMGDEQWDRLECLLVAVESSSDEDGGGDCPSEPQGKDLICQKCEQEFFSLSARTSTECTGCRT